MRIEVWEPPVPTPEAEKVVRLRMVQTCRAYGSTFVGTVMAVDEYGRPLQNGCVADLRGDGLKRLKGVDPALGLPLDDKGRVVLVRED